MNFRSTAKLLVVLLVLCGAYVGMGLLKDKGRQKVIDDRALFDFDAAEITRLTISPIDEEPTTGAQIAPGEWEIVEPATGIRPADVVWNRAAENLAGLAKLRILMESIPDLSIYGLDEPILEIEAETDSGETVSLAFGKMDPTQSVRYACFKDGALFTVTGDQFYELNRKREFLRHQFLVDDREASLLRIEIAQIWNGAVDAPPSVEMAIGEESTPLVLTRDEENAPWKMISPITAAADQDKAEALAKEIRGGRGLDYVDAPEHLSDYGLAPARMRISFVDNAEGERQTLLLGALDQQTKGIYAKHEGRDAVFIIDPQIGGHIPQNPLAIRERRMLTRPIGEAESIDYSYNGTRILFTNEENKGWNIRQPTVDETDQRALSVFITGLKSVEAAEFVEGTLQDYGLNNPLMSVRIAHALVEDSMHVRINRVGEDEAGVPRWFAVQQDSGDIMRIDARYAQALIVDARNFRSLRLTRFSPEEAKRIELTVKGSDYVFEKAYGKWLVRTPENASLSNQSDVERILTQFSRLEAKGIEARDSGDDVRYGVAEPVLAFQVTTQVEGEAETLNGPLRVGALAGESLAERYARIAGRSGVFRVSQDLITAVEAALRGVRSESGGNN